MHKIVRLTREKEVTPAQLALAWVLAQGEDVVAMPGTKRRAYLQENIAADQVRLTDEDLIALDTAAPPGVAVGDRYPASLVLYLNR